MIIDVCLQNPNNYINVPTKKEITRWVNSAIQPTTTADNMVVRIVDTTEIQQLNSQFRQQNKATNVLSFPAPPLPPPFEDKNTYLGDTVICQPIMLKESQVQKKTNTQHWAHILIHSTLHLQGYDHIDEDEALRMEALEIAILKQLGFPDPYSHYTIS